jgi:hypothetical protein
MYSGIGFKSDTADFPLGVPKTYQGELYMQQFAAMMIGGFWRKGETIDC